MNFSEALRRIRLGAKLNRLSWKPGNYVEWSENPQFIAFKAPQFESHWIPTQGDILAEDWVDPAE